MVQVGAARDAPRQMLGDERRLEALDQPCQPLEMRGVEPLGAAEREPDAVDRQRIVGAQPLQAPHGRSAARPRTRRYHGLLVAALDPPLGRTLLAAQVHDSVDYGGRTWALFCGRWAGGVAEPSGYQLVERFRLDGTTPVWTYAVAEALIEKRVWMEPGANTTYLRWRVLRAREPVALTVK